MIHRESEIIQWGVDRNILRPTGEGTKHGQQKKTEEEVIELHDAILLHKNGCHDWDENGEEDMSDIKDAIGDIVVTLIMQANLCGLTMEDCIEAAWQQIKDRRGRMVNGVFVKE